MDRIFDKSKQMEADPRYKWFAKKSEVMKDIVKDLNSKLGKCMNQIDEFEKSQSPSP
jgi:hypothetical protein